MSETQPAARLSPLRTPDKQRLLSAEELLHGALPAASGEAALPSEQLAVIGLLSFGHENETVFQFGRLNLLVGPNGSDNSNLLSCIQVFRLDPLDIQGAFQDSGFEDWLHKCGEGKGPKLGSCKRVSMFLKRCGTSCASGLMPPRAPHWKK